MSYHVRISEDVVKDFAKACKVMGFKQNGVLEGYMKEIIRRAEQIETLKNIDGILGISVPIFHDGSEHDVFVNINDKSHYIKAKSDDKNG